MIDAMSDSLVALESKVAMLEHTVDLLSDELAAQQKRIDFLQTNFAALVQQQKRARSNDAIDAIEPHDTPPPHWGS